MDGVYITQLLEKADRSMSLSFRKKIDEAMFGEVSKIPIFNEFKQPIENIEHSEDFQTNYLQSRSQVMENDK